jgi:vitamin B12 transporter
MVPRHREFFLAAKFLDAEIFSGSAISDRCFAARRRKARAWRPRSPDVWPVALLVLLASLGICSAQDAVTPLETGELVISATRLPTLAEEVPASVSVVTAQDFENRQVERVADALRSLPGVAVVQSGTAGQLTSVFTRGLRSEHTQVLLDGVPINQGLAGLFNFADLTIDNIDRIEVVRGPQSTVYGPRALAGVIQIFTKQGRRNSGSEREF